LLQAFFRYIAQERPIRPISSVEAKGGKKGAFLKEKREKTLLTTGNANARPYVGFRGALYSHPFRGDPLFAGNEKKEIKATEDPSTTTIESA